MEKLIFLTNYLKDLIQNPEELMEDIILTEENLEIEEEIKPNFFLNQFNLMKNSDLEGSFTDDYAKNLNLHGSEGNIDKTSNKINLSAN